jgi:RNA polymerase sigma-70 factor (family 1)
MRTDQNEIRQLQEKICRHNDEQAFASLFRLSYKRLYHFSLQYVKVHEAAEEVVNDVFVKLWSYRSSLQNINNLESYLFIAVKNQSLNYIKQYSHYHVAINEETAEVQLLSKTTPQHNLEWKELHFKLHQAIDQLPDQCRKIFKLVKEEGFRFKQVAEILNISPRTVETQLYRALKRLDAVLDEHVTVKKKSSPHKNKLISISMLIMSSFLFFV